MGLLVEYLLRRSVARSTQLTNVDNAGGLRAQALTGTLTLVQGSAAVVGAGTLFLTEMPVNQVIVLSTQPNVVYVVSAVASHTALTLSKVYFGAASTTATATRPAINYSTLEQAVGDAQAHFQARTNFTFDDTTATTSTTPANINKCIWAGVSLVDYYLYEYRGTPGEDSQKAAALTVAERRLKEILYVYGDGAWGAPATDSVFIPSTGPTRLPEFDNQRWTDIAPSAPGPGPSDISGAGGFDGSWGW